MLNKLAVILSTFILTLVFAVSPVSAEYVQSDELDLTEYNFTTTSDENYQYKISGSYSNNYTTKEMTEEEAQAFLGIMLTIYGMIFILIVIPMYIYMSWAQMVISNKLNVPNSWMAWVPVLNIYNFVKLAGFSGWKILLFLVPFVNFVFLVICYIKIAERRGFEKLLGLLILVPLAQVILPGFLAWAEPSKKTE